jgi:hypothetical protein
MEGCNQLACVVHFAFLAFGSQGVGLAPVVDEGSLMGTGVSWDK